MHSNMEETSGIKLNPGPGHNTGVPCSKSGSDGVRASAINALLLCSPQKGFIQTAACCAPLKKHGIDGVSDQKAAIRDSVPRASAVR